MRQGLAPRVFLMTGGLLVWAALFLFCYVFTALACTHGLVYRTFIGIGVVPLVLALATMAALGAVALVLRAAGQLDTHAARRADDIESVAADVASMVCLLALIGILWNAMPPLLVGVRC